MGSIMADNDGCQYYRAVQWIASTTMKDEVVLLSWLIVLLRARDDVHISFQWAYKDGSSEPTIKSLKMEEVMPDGIENTVGVAIHNICKHIATEAQTRQSMLESGSLLLSTGSLSFSPNQINEDSIVYVEVSLQNQTLEVRPARMSDNILPFTVTRHIETLAHIVQTGLSNPNTTIQSFLYTIPYDLDNIWRWNHTLPPTYNFCMHDMVAERACRSPTKVAICSWDGDLTYAQVDQYSTQVACTLQQRFGVRQGDIVPVCFEKSRWTVVAVLAVMKAGATFVMMDPSLPLGRLQNMAVQVDATTIITSRHQHGLSVEILPSGNYFVVEADVFAATAILTTAPQADLQPVAPSTLMYIIFTSGSTGTPKGVTVSHRTYTSSAVPRAQAVGYSETSRVLDFASYAFDVSIDSMLLTLGNGGCLCIPSDEDRLNDINGVIRRMEVNYAGITPSVARILEPDVIASLSGGLGLGGEAASARDVAIWGRDARIIIGYGPCECTIGCTVNSSAATGRDYISIGTGNGAAIWIVRPDDHDSLVPVGAVGELLVEGPIVGQGYLNDPEKTAGAFIEDPPWLTAGHNNHAGRRGRLYKTGDLGRYDPDGSGGIVFVGRKDTQVKLRGQRVELGEIESQLQAVLPTNATVIVEVIKPQGQPSLVAFVAITQSAANHGRPSELQSVDFTAEQHGMLASANAEIAKVLPRYMVPTAYIPVNHIPVLISGKTDRKRLREFGATVDLRQLDQNISSQDTARGLTEIEQRLRDAWASVLQLDSAGIRLQDNFFALGGDSLSAMRLVPVCRAHGLDLTVAHTFNNPTLSAMASIITACTIEDRVQSPAFSLITGDAESVCHEASQACGVTGEAVEDIYPCTPTQESLFTFSLRSAEPYIAQRVACIPQNTDLDAWKKAWEQVVAKSPILRTRLAQLHGEPGLQQVVLNAGSIQWKEAADLEHYLNVDHAEKMGLGESLARYAIITSPDEKRYMVWTVHHVLYDGWSEPLILKQVSEALQGVLDTSSTPQIRQFVSYVRDIDETAMQQYWSEELHGAVGPQFPRLPSRDHVPNPDAMSERHISLPNVSPGWPFTVATIIRGAWALLASRYVDSDDIVFGETLTGRDIPLAGVEDIIGPLIATVPVRIRVSRADTVSSYLQTVQQGPLSRTPYQHMGMQNIRKVSDDAQHACEAPTGLVIQPEPEYVGDELGFAHGDVVREALHFNPYPLMLACGIQKTGGFRVCASFDSAIIAVAQMECILSQLETVCHELMDKGLSRSLNEISCVPEVELNQIWQWNKTPPLPMDEDTVTPRGSSAINLVLEYPPAVVPWVCDLHNPSLLSPIGSPGELCLETRSLQGHDTVSSPDWLVAGSSIFSGRQSKVQRTGEIVQLRDDGTIVFLGRKESVVSLHGHALNIPDLEGLFDKYLPATVRAVAVISETPSQDSGLVVFIESPESEMECVTLMSTEHSLAMEGFKSAICTRIPIRLAAALKRLDKFIRDSLPSYMAPACYIPIQSMPTNGEQVDRAMLSYLGSEIEVTTKRELTKALQAAWEQSSTQADLTVAEKVLRSAWATVLRVPTNEIDVDDNFFRRGGDSVLAMKLVAALRADGHRLTVADIFQHMRLGDAAKLLKVDSYTLRQASVQSYQPFSTLGESNVEQFCQATIRPKLVDPSWGIQDVYPVTDSQALDIRGTIHAPRTSFQYTTLYFDAQIDVARLIRATTELIQQHDILRTVFIQHKESFLQVVLDRLDDSVVTTAQQPSDDDNFPAFINRLCNEDIESPFTLGSPFLRIFHVQDSASRHHCLVLGLSHAQYDGISLPQFLRDLDTLYTNPHQVLQHIPFSHYISRIHDSSLQSDATTYWRSILHDSTLSVLPGQTTQPTDRAMFRTHPVSLSHDPSTRETTPATLLTSAWALVLARRLQTADVTFGGVTMGRQIEVFSLAGTKAEAEAETETETEIVAGPCYQLTPIRVVFQDGWTARDLLRSVQQQGAESAGHDFLGFARIRDECTRWSKKAVGFDSLVHHQDWEDFDTLDFAGARCLVDQEDPHGDAPAPMKIVSFVREGRMHVGVVGSERDGVLVDEVLGELVNAVEELGGEKAVLTL